MLEDTWDMLVMVVQKKGWNKKNCLWNGYFVRAIVSSPFPYVHVFFHPIVNHIFEWQTIPPCLSNSIRIILLSTKQQKRMQIRHVYIISTEIMEMIDYVLGTWSLFHFIYLYFPPLSSFFCCNCRNFILKNHFKGPFEMKINVGIIAPK